MSRPTEEPTKSTGTRGGERLSHPAFGQIGAARISGGARLYGSDFLHNAYIVVRIKRSALDRDVAREWNYAENEIIEVALSESQWATFISSMNMGETPCTIQALDGKMVPGIPPRNQDDAYRSDIRKNLEAPIASLKALRAKIVANTTGLSKAKAAELLEPIDDALRQLTENLPHVADCFDEHIEDRVEKAKVEVHGYINQVLARAGLEHLNARQPIELIGNAEDETNEK